MSATAAESAAPSDPFDAARPLGASGALAAFAGAGLLQAADVHVARLLGRLAEPAGGVESGETVLLAAALAVRALRLGSVCVDLTAVAASVSAEAEDDAGVTGVAPAADATAVPLGADGVPVELPWPDPARWLEAMEASALVGVGPPVAGATTARPLRLDDGLLYLDRYWSDERLVAEVIDRHCRSAAGVDMAVLADGLARLFGGEAAGQGPDLQRVAAASAVLGRFTVVSGGPGTGKTTTVARLLALVHEQARAAGTPPPLVALAAPTGKAAARLEQAVHEAAGAPADLEADGAVAGAGPRAGARAAWREAERWL